METPTPASKSTSPATPQGSDVDTLVRTVIGEAEDQPVEGQAAVAWVVLNRLKTPGWWSRDKGDGIPDDTIAAVCRDPYQFSCWNPGHRADFIKGVARASALYQRVLLVVLSVLKGRPDPTASIGGATHYKVVGTAAMWDRATVEKPSVTIGKHVFFNLGLGG